MAGAQIGSAPQVRNFTAPDEVRTIVDKCVGRLVKIGRLDGLGRSSSNRAGGGRSTTSRRPRRRAARSITSGTRSPDGCASAWMTARSSRSARATSSTSPPATTHGSSATSPAGSSTGPSGRDAGERSEAHHPVGPEGPLCQFGHRRPMSALEQHLVGDAPRVHARAAGADRDPLRGGQPARSMRSTLYEPSGVRWPLWAQNAASAIRKMRSSTSGRFARLRARRRPLYERSVPYGGSFRMNRTCMLAAVPPANATVARYERGGFGARPRFVSNGPNT